MVEPLPNLTAGTVLNGRYRLESHLGSGATSAVWKARDLDLGRVVAVKTLLGAGVDPQLAGRFEREGMILGRLSHPNVVPVYATGNHEGRPYLVMALVDGVPFDEVLRDGPLPVDDALDLAADVAAGLAAAHLAGVVHRDVKPANIVCGSDGTPRLVDFGIARADDLTSMTQADSVLGTANYLSPEQARGEVPGPASDVYALGCVLHEALTGAPPFAGDSPLTVAYRHVHDEPTAPSASRDEVPAGVDAIVLRCLAKDPAQRYPGGAELEADLRRARRGEAPASVAAETAAMAPVADATLLLPAVEDDAPVEVIDPAPLAPPEPRSAKPWGIAAAACVAVLLVALLLGNLAGGGGGSGTPAGATTDGSTSTTVATTLVTAPPTTVAPAPAPKPPKGKGHGKRDD